jgi:PIN domain nuclease of toxin-antitoxin system
VTASRPVLLDAGAALWLMNRDPMSAASRKAIAQAAAANLGVYVSPISAWEIATLAAKNRIRLTLTPQIWFETLIALPGVRLAEMRPAVLIASASLPGTPPKDPADRILAATARAYGYVIVTRDGELLPYGQAGHVDVVPC